MFGIRNEPFGPFTKYVLLNLSTGEYVSIIPAYGGNVTELVLRKKEKLHTVLDGNKTADDLKKDLTYKGAQLIPFSGRIEDGLYAFQGKTYRLPVNEDARNHALHGFVHDKKFEIVKVSERKEEVSLELSFAYNKEVPGYPFGFRSGLLYSLSAEGFKMQTTVENTGIDELPFSCGWHPYFTFGMPVDDLYLHLPSRASVLVNERLIPTGRVTEDPSFGKPARIGTTQLDNNFMIENGKTAKTTLYSEKDNTAICLWQETGRYKYNYLQVYIPPHRMSITIEPVTSQANAYNNGKGLIVLRPGERFKTSCGVFLR